MVETAIREANKTVIIKDISDSCGISYNATKRIISKLIEEGKVERSDSNKKGGFRWKG